MTSDIFARLLNANKFPINNNETYYFNYKNINTNDVIQSFFSETEVDKYTAKRTTNVIMKNKIDAKRVIINENRNNHIIIYPYLFLHTLKHTREKYSDETILNFEIDQPMLDFITKYKYFEVIYAVKFEKSEMNMIEFVEIDNFISKYKKHFDLITDDKQAEIIKMYSSIINTLFDKDDTKTQKLKLKNKKKRDRIKLKIKNLKLELQCNPKPELLNDDISELTEIEDIETEEEEEEEETNNSGQLPTLTFNKYLVFPQDQQLYITDLLINFYETNDKFKMLCVEYNTILIIKPLHYDNNKLNKSLHFNIKLCNNTIQSPQYHAYINNNTIISLTEIKKII